MRSQSPGARLYRNRRALFCRAGPLMRRIDEIRQAVYRRMQQDEAPRSG
jgi:hypothetical protein